MKQIVINEYVCNLSAVRNITRESLKPFEDVLVSNHPIEEKECFFLAWGDPIHKCKTGTMETGFFWDAIHIDTVGLYSHSSLNTPAARNIIMAYKAPVSAAELVLGGRLPPSKYRQVAEKIRWDGVVLALQNPADRSVHRGGSTADYYRFVESACAKYRKHLFLKLHPWNSGEVETRFRELAHTHGCTIGRVDHSVIEHSKFVLVYNSTFVVDCLIRGVPVVQYAPGYFYQCPGVHYSSFQFPDEVASNREDGYKLCDFLVWRYCINQAVPTARLVDSFRVFAESKELFPLPEHLSYGSQI